MVEYKLEFSPHGLESIEYLDKNIIQRIFDKLKWLISRADEISHIPLRSNLSGLYKLRVGDWRIIYEIDHKKRMIRVHKIGHRRDIYKI